MLFEDDVAAHEVLDEVFARPNPKDVIENLLPVVVRLLRADRCFVQLRQPSTRLFRIVCHRAHSSFPDFSCSTWGSEEAWEEAYPLYRKEPMLYAALAGAPSFFIEDIETSTEINRELERKELKHRSFVHAHIYDKGKLHGILQPCVFGAPRVWTCYDRALIAHLVLRLVPVVKSIVASELPEQPLQELTLSIKSSTKKAHRKLDKCATMDAASYDTLVSM